VVSTHYEAPARKGREEEERLIERKRAAPGFRYFQGLTPLFAPRTPPIPRNFFCNSPPQSGEDIRLTACPPWAVLIPMSGGPHELTGRF
jgi:hypothetical protein